jgi:hypothetical protein
MCPVQDNVAGWYKWQLCMLYTLVRLVEFWKHWQRNLRLWYKKGLSENLYFFQEGQKLFLNI